MKYRKKPIIVEAEQFLPFEDDRGLPQSNIHKVYKDIINSKTNWSIDTLEGRYDVTPNDFIIKGIKGEFYPCKPDIFEQTYEEVGGEKNDS